MSDVVGDTPLIEASTAARVTSKHAAPEGATRAERARSAAYRKRFLAVYAALAIVVGAAAVGLVVALTKTESVVRTPTAAAFDPSSSGELGAVQLAESIQLKYRRTNGEEFVGVVASRNTLQDGNLGLIRVRYQYIQPYDSSESKDSRVVAPNSALQYSLCGSGAGCVIPGTASPTRFALLKRQGLELALRTFQTDSSVDNVAVFLRPVEAPQGWEGYALVFDRPELNRDMPNLISNPIGETLPGPSKTFTTKDLTAKQITRIDEITRPYLYLFRYQLLGGRDALMQLQPAKG